MKKIKTLICVLLAVLMLSGCGKKTETVTENINGNITENITENITGNITENITTGITENTTETSTDTNTETVESSSAETTDGNKETADTSKTAVTTEEERTTAKAQTVTQVTTTEEKTTSKVIKTEKTTVAVTSPKKPTTTKAPSQKPVPTKPKPTASTTEKKAEVCYITITCDTINDNIDDLKDSKKQFVASDGIILGNVAVEFEKGDTAFDILKKACAENHCKANCRYCKNGVQLEYTYTPAFNTYYVEGIHQLYEKDCGMQSGWMYSVNGVFPNVGSSSYSVKEGDKIVFAYTCDMGDDIGNYY